MRVIAGTYRSRALVAPAGLETRPTSDRLRETLGNMIAQRLPGSRFVDLYAGSGAVGIEALSRGAEFVWFAENAPAAVSALKKNLQTLGIAAGYAIEDRGVGRLLNRLLERPPVGGLDLVYLDPPYEAEAEYTETLRLLGSERARTILSPDVWVVAEHSKKRKLAERYGALHLLRSRQQGEGTLSFFGYKQASDDDPESSED